MSTLRAPTHNPTECQVLRIDTRHGITRLALAMDTITKAVCWFASAELAKANAPADVEVIIRAHENLQAFKEILHSGVQYRDERDSYEWSLHYQIDVALGRKPLVVTMPADLLGHIRQALYCELKAA